MCRNHEDNTRLMKTPKNGEHRGGPEMIDISHLKPCAEAATWLETQTDIKTAWLSCQRGDWMLWLAAKLDLPRPLVVLAACDCARIALQSVPSGELRPLRAIEAAEAWTNNPTPKNLKLARKAAVAAAAASAADINPRYSL